MTPTRPTRPIPTCSSQQAVTPLASLSPVPPRRRHVSLSEWLEREWRSLAQRPGVLDTVRSWNVIAPGAPRIVSLDDLLRRTGFRTSASAAADAVLCRLVDLAATEPLAARIVLQRILPGLFAIAREEQQREPRTDAFDVLYAEAWMSIQQYRTASRSTQVAARLLSDARCRAFTNPRRRRRVVEVLRPPHRLEEPPPPDPSPFEELTTLLTDVRACGLPDGDLDVVRGLLRYDSAAGYAVHAKVDQRTVRYRRDRSVARIRKVLADTAAA
jgi:hypothetical protein